MRKGFPRIFKSVGFIDDRANATLSKQSRQESHHLKMSHADDHEKNRKQDFEYDIGQGTIRKTCSLSKVNFIFFFLGEPTCIANAFRGHLSGAGRTCAV